jgi:hypothetical protein
VKVRPESGCSAWSRSFGVVPLSTVKNLFFSDQRRGQTRRRKVSFSPATTAAKL